MNRYIALILLLLLAGCGADVMSTTATVAAGKAIEAEEGQKTQEHMTNQINDALIAGQQRMKEAE